MSLLSLVYHSWSARQWWVFVFMYWWADTFCYRIWYNENLTQWGIFYNQTISFGILLFSTDFSTDILFGAATFKLIILNSINSHVGCKFKMHTIIWASTNFTDNWMELTDFSSTINGKFNNFKGVVHDLMGFH